MRKGADPGEDESASDIDTHYLKYKQMQQLKEAENRDDSDDADSQDAEDEEDVAQDREKQSERPGLEPPKVPFENDKFSIYRVNKILRYQNFQSK